MTILPNSFYYLYVKIKNDKGFRYLEDVSIAYSRDGKVLVNEIDWKTNTDEFYQDIVPNPKTSDFRSIIIILIISVIMGTCVIVKKRLSKITKES